MSSTPPSDPTVLVLWCAFALSVVFGAIAQRTRFCTRGAIADVINTGDWARMRMWVLAIAIAILGFNAMVGLGWVAASKSLYGGPKVLWASALVGGLMFGFGMILAPGCGSRNLVRIGGGNLNSLVVMILMGLSAFATLKGITGVLRVATVDKLALQVPAGQDLPSLLGRAFGQPVTLMAPLLGVVVAVVLLAWVLRKPEGRSFDVWLGGLGVGAVIVALWWVSGKLGYVAEDPQTLEEVFVATNSHRMEALSMAAPVAYTLDWLMFFSDQSKVLTLGIVSVVGTIIGSAIVALARRTFRWEGMAGVQDTADSVVGALLMGVGGVTALGCTVGQGLSGISTLSLGSFLATAAFVVGAWLALRYKQWRLGRQAAA